MDTQHRQTQLMHLLDGMMRSQAIYTAAKLDLADRLGDGMKSISQLAQEMHMHEASLPVLGSLLRRNHTPSLIRSCHRSFGWTILICCEKRRASKAVMSSGSHGAG